MYFCLKEHFQNSVNSDSTKSGPTLPIHHTPCSSASAVSRWTTHDLGFSIPAPECLSSCWKELCDRQIRNFTHSSPATFNSLLCYSNIFCSQLTLLLPEVTDPNCFHSLILQVSSSSPHSVPVYLTVEIPSRLHLNMFKPLPSENILP